MRESEWMVSGQPTYVSLFCGCGGFDVGFVEAGYRCLGAYDIDRDAISTFQDNLPGPALIHDLSEGSLPITHRQLDVLLAGTPCQGFSTAGKRDPKDPRNKLLVRAAELASQLRPKVVVIENVVGLASGEQQRFLTRAVMRLRRDGYSSTQITCDANEMGVPQRRRRILIIAWRTKRDVVIDIPRTPGGTLRDALRRIHSDAPDHAPVELDNDSRPGMIARCIGVSQKLCNVRISERSVHTWDIPEVFGRTSRWERTVLSAVLRRRRQQRLRDFGDADPVTAHAIYRMLGRPVATTLKTLVSKGYIRHVNGRYDLVHTFNGKFRRLTWTAPAPTVDGRFGDPYYFLHPTQHRAFTVREAARVQGFPDDFVFGGSVRKQYRLIGNAVPPPLARILANYLRNTLL